MAEIQLGGCTWGGGRWPLVDNVCVEELVGVYGGDQFGFEMEGSAEADDERECESVVDDGVAG